MAKGSREFGEYQTEEFPGISPALLGPGNEPMGFEGLALAAPGEELLDQYQREMLQQQQSQNTARVSISPQEETPVWEKNFTFGAVKKPEQNTLRAYKRLLRIGSGKQDIQFSPEKYSIFDGVIVDQSGKQGGKSLNPAFNPDHAYYESYAPLRRNLAILRNYILVNEFPDAEYKPHERSAAGKEDAANYTKVLQMADRLGAKLAAGRPGLLGRFAGTVKRLMSGEDLSKPDSDAFIQAANVPDTGIAVMYDYLYKLQAKPSFADMWPFSQTPRSWGLASVAQTPFSETNMLQFSRAHSTQGIALEFDRILTELRSIDTLSTETKKISVDYAREILEKLKLLMGNTYEESVLGRTSDPHEDEAWMLLRAARSYKDIMTDIAQIDPAELRDNPLLSETYVVLEQISYRVKAEAVMMLTEEGKDSEAKLLAAQLAGMPASAKTNVPLSQLVGQLKSGVNEAARIRQNLLVRSSQQQAAQQQVKVATAKAAATGVVPTNIPKGVAGASAAKAAANIAGAAQTFQAARVVASNNAHHVAELQHAEDLRHGIAPTNNNPGKSR